MVDQGLDGHIPLSALRPMYRALAAVNAAVGLGETLQAIADGVVSCTPFQHVSVNVVRSNGDVETTNVSGPESLQAMIGKASPGAVMKRAMEDAEEWGRLRFLRNLDAFLEENVPVHLPEDVPRESADPEAWLQDYSLLAPMYGPGEELVGLIGVDVPSDGKMPRSWVLEILEAFAEQAAIAIVNANRHEQATARMARLERERELLRNDIAQRRQHEADLRHQARHDPLTGLANSAELRERLADLVVEGVPLAVYFCDLDLFKSINDTFGHAIGDLVLRHVADRLRNAVRGGDIVARLGGDEFVVVAVDVGRAEAYALLDRLDQAFAHPVTVDGHPPQLVGASLGIAYDPATEHSDLVAKERAEELLSAADSKMYARKRSRAAISRLTAQAWPTRESPPAQPPGAVDTPRPVDGLRRSVDGARRSSDAAKPPSRSEAAP
jgi:diguanylate cyclase (GGDEF)-like protein